MSGMEPLLIGAAIGGGVSAATGGNPLLGAALGAAGGGLGGLAGGAGGAASGAAGGAASGAGAGAGSLLGGASTAPLVSGTLNPALSSFVMPGAMSTVTAPITATAAPITTSALGIGAGSGLGPTLTAAKTGVMQGAALGDGVSTFERLQQMAPMAGELLGGQKQQPQMAAPQVRRGEAPQLTGPIDELMRMQMMAQRQRRPISLL